MDHPKHHPPAIPSGAPGADPPRSPVVPPADLSALDSFSFRATDPFAPESLDAAGRRALAVGIGLAIVITAVPFLRFIFGYLGVLIHEFGHTAAGWFFGFPSVPAFDFGYGGGVTLHGGRNVGVALLVSAGLVALGVWHRENRRALIFWIIVASLHGLAMLTAADELAILAAGHGAEIFLASIFLYRALSGRDLRSSSERPAYAFCALFLYGTALRFAWGLWTSPAARADYGQAKGGGHWMDFSRLAQHLDLSVQSIAFLYLLATLAAIVFAILAFRHRRRLTWALGELAGA